MKAWWIVVVLAAAAGCNALLDIDHIAFGDPTSTGGGAGAASSASTGATGGSAGEGIGGFPAAEENCANGVDDNGDNLVDCADPLCTCAPPAPMNWSGPVVLYNGASEAACPADWPAALEVGHTDVTADPVSCDGCTCGNPSVSCSSSLTLWPVSGCQMSSTFSTPLTSQNCGAITAGTYLSAKAAPPTASGSCTPAGGGVTQTPPVVYNDYVTLCGGAVEGSTCAMRESCVPLPPAPFLSQVCIYRTGGGSCPSNSPYTEEHSFYTGVNDYRSCAACTCGGVSGASCNASTTVYAGASCTGASVTVPTNDVCTALSINPVSRRLNSNPSGGSCAPSGGTPDGGVDLDGTVTVCCLP